MALIEKKCKEYCPLECDTIKYIGSEVSFKTDKSLSYLRIFYEELKYTRYSEIPKTEPFDFISSIGGILGLFIGCSFVTFFELAEVLLEICFILFAKKKVHIPSRSQNDILTLEEKVKILINENREMNAKIEFLFKSISTKQQFETSQSL